MAAPGDFDAVIFDLDYTLADWDYTSQQAMVTVNIRITSAVLLLVNMINFY